jgi:hypothetical protein
LSAVLLVTSEYDPLVEKLHLILMVSRMTIAVVVVVIVVVVVGA